MEDDICRNRHGGNPESEEANLKTSKEKGRLMVLKCLGSFRYGATCDNISLSLGMPYTTASARCSELLRDGLIERKPNATGGYERAQTRTGSYAAVLQLTARQPEFHY